jgi:hypothetical protein
VTLVLLAETLPQFTIGRDKCSTSGAQHRFVVVQYFRITESKTSASWATQLGSRVEASFSVVVKIHVLVDRHGAQFCRPVEPIQLYKDSSSIRSHGGRLRPPLDLSWGYPTQSAHLCAASPAPHGITGTDDVEFFGEPSISLSE